MNLNNLNIKTIFYKTFRVNALTCHFIISNHSIRSCNWSCKILPPYIYNNFLILVTCGTRVCHDVTSEYISVHKQQRQITLTLESGGLFDFAEMINLTYNFVFIFVLLPSGIKILWILFSIFLWKFSLLPASTLHCRNTI